MPLVFKHFKQITEDWLSYVIGHSNITDINPGSTVRTLGEATALEGAQIYVQLQSLLNLFSIDKASGSDLDERAVDFDLIRNSPITSSGVVTVGDSNLTVADIVATNLVAPLTAGVSTTAQVIAGPGHWDALPASGSIIVDRENSLRELIAYTSKTGPDLLNLATFPAFGHLAGATVYKSTAGADRPIPSGTTIKTTEAPVLRFETTVADTLLDGDYQVPNIQAVSLETGSVNNVAAGRIDAFESPPFPTATVTNPGLFYGGQDLESDDAFRSRIKLSQQRLSSSTVLRIETEALGVVLESTGQRVVTAKVIEPIIPGASELYINDGSASYTPTTIPIISSEFLIGKAEAGQSRAGLYNWPVVVGTEKFFVSLERGTSTSVGVDTITDTTKTWIVNAWAGLKVKDENNIIYSIVSNTATTLTLSGGLTPENGAYAIFDPSVTTWPTGSLLVSGVDYIFNPTNGQAELLATSFPTGLNADDCWLTFYDGVTPSYTYYDGILQEVQKVLNGDPNDRENYPGVIAAGGVIYVRAPTVVTITVVGSLVAQTGIDETTIRDSVKRAILDYINNLTIGEDVVVARIVEAAMGIQGVFDFNLIVPSGNVIITASQLAKTTLGDITVT